MFLINNKFHKLILDIDCPRHIGQVLGKRTVLYNPVAVIYRWLYENSRNMELHK